MMMDETRLIEKLKLVEALFSGAGTTGERAAADHARQRILERLRTMEREDPPVEHRFSMPDLWSRRVFLALLRRYGLRPYRYPRQRHTTVMARVSQRFVDETLWPQYLRFSDTLSEYLSEVTSRVVSEVISDDLSEADEVSHSAPLAADPAAEPTVPTATPARGGNGQGNDRSNDRSNGQGNDRGKASEAGAERTRRGKNGSGRGGKKKRKKRRRR